MAELKSVTYTAQEAAADNAGSYIATAELISGKSSFLQCHWLVPAGTANLDTVLLGYLPSGMTLVPGLSTITIDTAAGANTIDIGISGTTDNIADEQDVNTIGTSFINTTGVGSVSASARTAIVATLNGTVTAASNIWFNFTLVNSN